MPSPGTPELRLKVDLPSGKQLTEISVPNIWSLTQVKNMVTARLVNDRCTCQELLSKGNWKKLDAGMPIGEQVENGDVIVAVMSEIPKIQAHVAALNLPKVSSRYHAIEALADFGPKCGLIARHALERTLLNDSNGLVRKSAARALGLLGSKEAAPCLTQVAHNDSCQFVRGVAMCALMELGVVQADQTYV